MHPSMVMVIFIKQHLNNTWSTAHEKDKQHIKTKLKESVAYKKACNSC